MCKSFLPGLVTAFVFLAVTTSVSFAQVRDIFSVSGIAVDSRANNDIAAKSAGISQGETNAFRMLLERLTLRRDHNRLPNIHQKKVAALFRKDYSVDAERFGGGRYLATLTVRFKAEEVRKLLGDADIPFAEVTGRPVLVLPIFQTKKATTLWGNRNPWFAAWSRVRSLDGLQPLLLPAGDRSDALKISAEEALLGDKNKLARLADKYGAAEMMVVVASFVVDQSSKLLSVDVASSRFGGDSNDQTLFRRFKAQAGMSHNSLLDRAAISVVNDAEDGWKKRNIIKRGINRLIVVQIPIGNLADWVSIRKRLDTIVAIEVFNVLQLSVNRVDVELAYLGNDDQLQLAMAQSELDLKPTTVNGVWTLHLKTGR